MSEVKDDMAYFLVGSAEAHALTGGAIFQVLAMSFGS